MNASESSLILPKEQLDGVSADQLVSIRNPEQSDPIFCLHPSGGDIGIYRKLAARLSAKRSVWGVQSRLLCGSHTEAATLEEMANDYCSLIDSHHPEGKIRLLGFSLGGFIASLMAEKFQQNSRVVSFLGLIDSNPAWTSGTTKSRQELCLRLTQVFTKFQSIGVMRQKPLEIVERDVAILVDTCLSDAPVTSAEMMAKTTAMGYVPDRQRDSDLLMQFTHTFLTHCRLLKGFSAPEIDCPLHLWWPSDGEQENEIGSAIWAGRSKFQIEESCIEGSHYSIMRGAAVRRLAEQVDAAIERTELPG